MVSLLVIAGTDNVLGFLQIWSPTSAETIITASSRSVLHRNVSVTWTRLDIEHASSSPRTAICNFIRSLFRSHARGRALGIVCIPVGMPMLICKKLTLTLWVIMMWFACRTFLCKSGWQLVETGLESDFFVFSSRRITFALWVSGGLEMENMLGFLSIARFRIRTNLPSSTDKAASKSSSAVGFRYSKQRGPRISLRQENVTQIRARLMADTVKC